MKYDHSTELPLPNSSQVAQVWHCSRAIGAAWEPGHLSDMGLLSVYDYWKLAETSIAD